ncbi:MAG: carbohydrate kinase [Lachnospiraceae bacterium]|nr:carbohydrate kinase [Lachnospiraceae bacterium]
MEKRFDVVALGELLIDFTPAGISEHGTKLFEQNPGGAPANMLTAVNKAGLKTAFIGKVGNDMHGNYLQQTLKEAGIDTEGIVVDNESFTTLAFVDLTENGERTFAFARKLGADTRLWFKEVNTALIKNTKVFHVGSLSLTDEPVRTTTFEAVKLAKKAGAFISYDPNYREPLWENKEVAMARMQSMISYADMIKISDEETNLMTSYAEPKEAAEYLIGIGVKVVAVTLGAKGVLICNEQGSMTVPGFESKVIDTTGAGDSFWGAFVSQMIKNGEQPQEYTLEELGKFARYGNAVASLCVERRGGISGIPDEKDVLERLKNK